MEQVSVFKPSATCWRHVIKGPPPKHQIWECKDLWNDETVYERWVQHLAAERTPVMSQTNTFLTKPIPNQGRVCLGMPW